MSNKNIEIILKSSDGSIVQPSIPTLQQTVIKTYDVELMESLSTEVDSLSSNVIVLQNNVSSLSTELDTVNELMKNASPEAKLAWEYATVFDRNSSFINEIAVQLSLSSEQIDTMFSEASLIL